MDESKRTKYQDGAEGLLEPEERVELAATGLKHSPLRPLVSIIPFLQPFNLRTVMLTDRNVYVLRAGPGTKTKSRAVVAKHPRGSVEVQASGSSLLVGDEGVALGMVNRGTAKEISEAAGPVPSAGSGL
jgi:hypothetical protein